MEKIIKLIKKENLGIIKENESMKNHTYVQTGGKVTALFIPNTIESLKIVIEKLNRAKIRYFIIGKGSNLLFPDEDQDIFIIKIANTFETLEIGEDGSILVGSGYSLQKLSKQLSKLGFSGLEFAGGIPATIGGATYMNAGAHSGDMSSVIKEVKTVTNKGEIKQYKKEKCNFAYRSSIFQTNNEIITEIKLKLTVDDKAKVFKRVMGNLEYRKEMQPLDKPSFGSVFQNPKGFYSAKLIEECGLKGKQIGGAKISSKHANFIINTGDATTEDVLSLINIAKARVKEETGLELHEEVIFLKGKK